VSEDFLVVEEDFGDWLTFDFPSQQLLPTFLLCTLQ
jgi:hypothetical protein